MFGGILNEEHRARFEAARAKATIGQPGRAICGAKTRNGGICQHPPVTGFSRCRKHCGPKGHRAVRERELKALGKGKLAFADWVRREDRRAATRITERWKKDPWAPGATLSLGTHDGAFCAEMAAQGWAVPDLPPSVTDWARWKYRRAFIDRRQPDIWARAMEQMADRVARAGEAPFGHGLSTSGTKPPVYAVPDKLSPYSKRRRLDPKPVEQKPKEAPRAPFADELADLMKKYAEGLEPILLRCGSDMARLVVLRAYDRLAASDHDAAAYDAWREALQAARVG